MNGQLFPDYIECAFLNTFRCVDCGRTGEPLKVYFPNLNWRRADNTILISYPVRCSCGKAGEVSTRLPFLLFCFIFGWLEYQGAPRHQPKVSPQEVWPGDSRLLGEIFCDFEEALSSFDVLLDKPTATDRILFGISPERWREFLRRLGFTANEGEQC